MAAIEKPKINRTPEDFNKGMEKGVLPMFADLRKELSEKNPNYKKVKSILVLLDVTLPRYFNDYIMLTEQYEGSHRLREYRDERNLSMKMRHNV